MKPTHFAPTTIVRSLVGNFIPMRFKNQRIHHISVEQSLATSNVPRYFEQRSTGQAGRSRQNVDPAAEVLSTCIWPP